MPEHIFTIAARGHSIDVQTNILTLFAVLEELPAPPRFPVVYPELSVITLWRRLPGEESVAFVQRTRFLEPDGEESGYFDQTFRLDRPRHRMIGEIRLFPIRKTGCHRIEVLIRRDDEPSWGRPVACYPIEVTATNAQQQPSLLDASGQGVSP
jgi:hypothetical protein